MKTNIYNYVFLLSILILALSIAQIVEFYQSEAFSVRETYNSSKRNMENLFKKKTDVVKEGMYQYLPQWSRQYLRNF